MENAWLKECKTKRKRSIRGKPPVKKKVLERRRTKKIDRLSNLPDSIIQHILSFMDTRYAVQTCILSKAWKNQWTELESLNFDDGTFTRWKDYAKFVRRVLRHRKPFNLRSLRYHCGFRKDKSLVHRICNYAKKHNLQELDTDLCSFHPRLYECQTLKTLKFGPNCSVIDKSQNPFGFSSLTTLQLSGVWLSGAYHNFDIFSSCLNLRNLFLIGCRMFALDIFSVSAPRLVNLKISNLEDCGIQNKTFSVSAPRLEFLEFKGRYPPIFLTNGCSSLSRVNILISLPPFKLLEGYGHGFKDSYLTSLNSMIDGFYNAKLITVVFDLSKVLSKVKLVLSLSVPPSFRMRNLIISCQGKSTLQRNSGMIADAETRGMEINKEIDVEWSIDLTKLLQQLCSKGFVFS